MTRLILICLLLLNGCGKSDFSSTEERWGKYLDKLQSINLDEFQAVPDDYHVTIDTDYLQKTDSHENPILATLILDIHGPDRKKHIKYTLSLIPVDGGWSLISGRGISNDNKIYKLGENEDDLTGLQKKIYKFMGGKLGDTLPGG